MFQVMKKTKKRYSTKNKKTSQKKTEQNTWFLNFQIFFEEKVVGHFKFTFQSHPVAEAEAVELEPFFRHENQGLS